MCGIYGSKKFNTYLNLYKLNKSRGNFAQGHLFVSKSNKYDIKKSSGSIDYTNFNYTDTKYRLFLGHTQSPTGSVREYSYNNSHPFENENWVLAHNGVLNNYKLIQTKYNLDPDKYAVDSSVIIPVIDYYNINRQTEEINSITQALNELEGTYSIFLYNKKTKNFYIARNGSTLFYSDKDFEFSSCETNNMLPVSDCSLYLSTGDTFKKVSSLKNNSSFIIF